eukprot:TRINITY_DN21827_c0_g1_i2.p1 TRINITY_DN21827_c0_g1~~TRINITY_DN21827_c0_g1_i2.p1  ORF type:complete len:566 (-),score=158.65 TRINITY_DN21827_c0_g1_i2:236-1933(-)
MDTHAAASSASAKVVSAAAVGIPTGPNAAQKVARESLFLHAAGLSAAEAQTARRLRKCKEVAAAVSAVVDTLGAAASSLQKALPIEEPQLRTPRCTKTADPVDDVADQLFAACRSMGLALISIAASLTSKVQKPLSDLQRAVGADYKRQSADLADLTRLHALSEEAAAESLEVKERVLGELQASLKQSPGDGDDASKAPFGWIRRLNPQTILAEARLQKNMALQSGVVEEYTKRAEEASELGDQVIAGAEAFVEVLSAVDYAVMAAFCSALGDCAGAWQAAASSLQDSARHLRQEANASWPREVPLLKHRQAPHWLRIWTGEGLGRSTAEETPASSEEASPEVQRHETASPYGCSEPASGDHRDLDGVAAAPSPVRKRADPVGAGLAEEESSAPSAAQQLASSMAAASSSNGACHHLKPKAGDLCVGGKQPAAAQSGLLPTDVDDADLQGLRRKMEEKRMLAELHNGEDLTTVPKSQLAPKGRQPGVHPSVAERLEARRRVIEAQESAASELAAAGATTGTAPGADNPGQDTVDSPTTPEAPEDGQAGAAIPEGSEASLEPVSSH